jgi:hypothetical protein
MVTTSLEKKSGFVLTAIQDMSGQKVVVDIGKITKERRAEMIKEEKWK